MHVLLYHSVFWKDLMESTGCGDITRDYPFVDRRRVPKEGHPQDGIEDRRESESWGYTLHRRNGEFEDNKLKNGRDAPLGRGQSGVGQYFGFVLELAQHMGWLTTNPHYELQPGYYHQGPNMLLVPINETGPKADYTKESFHDGSSFEEYTNTFAHSPVAVITEAQGWSVAYQGAHFMVLAKAFNWRVVRINEAFEKFKKTPLAVQTIERPLFVYVNLVESQWLEDSYDELPRTVPYKSGEAWWEPRQVQYHHLRRSRIETVHVRVTEVNQATTICLHFHRHHGLCHFTQQCLARISE